MGENPIEKARRRHPNQDFGAARAYASRLDELADDFRDDVQDHFTKRWRYEHGGREVGAQAIVAVQTRNIQTVLANNRDELSPNVDANLIQSIMYLENCYNGTPQEVENARTGLAITEGVAAVGAGAGLRSGNVPLTVGSVVVGSLAAVGRHVIREDTALPMNVNFDAWKNVLARANPPITSLQQISGRGHESENIRAAAVILSYIDQQIPANITGDLRTAMIASMYANSELTMQIGRPIMYGGMVVDIMEQRYPRREQARTTERAADSRYSPLVDGIPLSAGVGGDTGVYTPPRGSQGASSGVQH